MEERPSIDHQTLYFLALVNVNVNVPFKLHSQGRQGKPSGSGPKSRESEFCKRAGQIFDLAMMGSQGPNSKVPWFSPRSNAPDSETVLLCKTDGQRWYLDCLVSGTERQNYPVRGKVILESPHSVCWRKISADKCSLRAFYPQCGRQPSNTNVVALLRKRTSYNAWALWCVCCIGGQRVYLGRWESTLSL